MSDRYFGDIRAAQQPLQLLIEDPGWVELLPPLTAPGQRYVVGSLILEQGNIDVIFGQWSFNPFQLSHDIAGSPIAQEYWVGDRDLFTNAPRRVVIDYQPWILPEGSALYVNYPAAVPPPAPGDANGNILRVTIQYALI